MIDKFYDWIDELPDWVYSFGLIGIAFILGYVFMGGME